LLVVIDTLRADAVSAYGAVEGTTPEFDALAAEGLLYRHAFAPSPWTLPSHASLFSGLGVDRHGVGFGGQMGLSSELTTIAERLRDAGYATAGFSENPLVSVPFGMDRSAKRVGCGPEDRVFGPMAAITRWPFKLIWFQRYPAELYNLSWDPMERSDLAAIQTDVRALLLEKVQRLIDQAGLTHGATDEAATPSAEELEILQGLGYVE
jgi:hypothetical protein